MVCVKTNKNLSDKYHAPERTVREVSTGGGGAGKRRKEVVTNVIFLWNLEVGTLHFIGWGVGRCPVKGSRKTRELYAKVSLLSLCQPNGSSEMPYCYFISYGCYPV